MPIESLRRWITPARLMGVSVVVALLTIALKTLAWWLTGSVGLLSDALESFVNLAAAVFGLWMVTVAARPADEDHPFGHSKAEYFSSGFEGILILGAAAAIVWAALPRFWHPQPLEQLGWGMALSVASSVLNGVLAWIMLRASRTHRSIALEADAKHLLTDVWTSAGVVIGLVLAGLTGWLWLDPLVAIGVALNILREGGRLIWRSSQGLMDAAAEPQVQAKVDAVLAGFLQPSGDSPGNVARATGAGGVTAPGHANPVRIDHVLSRRAGQRHFLSMHLHLPADWSLGRAAAMRARVEQALLDAVPGLQVSIQLLPLGVEPLTELGEAAPTDEGTVPMGLGHAHRH
ncbi:cation transporter [Ottowia sp. GY511]|uniref:Cation diffusion facilitator family transporter n=1 Tax=Ottowia flava TaxID=2675430 RepID=A0ABW4KSQ3_9BURK|nr:cation diffusion facilitator family transporter [Ottowia sp. GY511]TXK32919.1 cation transporter [Ottowia sp. GY511]